MTFSRFILLPMFFFGLHAQAQNTGGGVYVGNGGDGIVCGSELPPPLGGEEVLVMDFWVAIMGAPMVPVSKEIQRFEKTETFEDAISFIEEKLAQAPEFYKQYRDIQKAIKIDNDSFVEGPLTDAHDEGAFFVLPSYCQKVQIALRRGPRVYLDKAWYGKLSDEQKALIYMHEYIYAVGALKFNHNSSVQTQSLMAYLLNENPSADELAQFLSDHFTLRP